MKLESWSVEDITQFDFSLLGIYNQIEKVGRISYKSESQITPFSAFPFVQKLISNKHLSPLEHATVVVPSTSPIYSQLLTNPYSVCGESCVFTNYRVIVENDLSYDFSLFPFPATPNRLSFKIKCPISISREFCRHRKFSFMEQSTRYCNFSKNKFGNELTFIKPLWFDTLDTDGKRIIFMHSLQEAEETYMNMVSYLKPQDAREVLPLCTKTELIMTGWLCDWQHFLDLRLSSSAHPLAREIALEIKRLIDLHFV